MITGHLQAHIEHKITQPSPTLAPNSLWICIIWEYLKTKNVRFLKGYLKNVLYISVPCTSEKNAMSGPETRSAVQIRSALALRNVSFPRIESRQSLDWRTPDLMGSSMEWTAVLKFVGSSTPVQRNHDQNELRRIPRCNALWSTIDVTSSRVRSKTKKQTRKQEDVKQ